MAGVHVFVRPSSASAYIAAGAGGGGGTAAAMSEQRVGKVSVFIHLVILKEFIEILLKRF